MRVYKKLGSVESQTQERGFVKIYIQPRNHFKNLDNLRELIYIFYNNSLSNGGWEIHYTL